MDETPLLTSKDVMNYLQVSRTKLWKMVKGGEIPAYRLGGELRYKKEDIDRFLEQNRTGQGDDNA